MPDEEFCTDEEWTETYAADNSYKCWEVAIATLRKQYLERTEQAKDATE